VSQKRHPAEVTYDRLMDALERWPDKFDAEERDYVGIILNRLYEISEGEQ
jgi:hypothetical protein